MTRYVWDPEDDNIALEKDDAGDVTVVYTQEPGLYGNLISQRRAGQTSYYHFDALGSTRALTDENENVTDTYLNDAWGVEKEHIGTTVNPFRWVGEMGYYTDEETGTVMARARSYKPENARWTVFDPSMFSDGPHRYSYSHNSPAILSDPSGRQTAADMRSKRVTSCADDPNECCEIRLYAHPAFGAFSPYNHMCLEVEGTDPLNPSKCAMVRLELLSAFEKDTNGDFRQGYGPVIGGLFSGRSSDPTGLSGLLDRWKRTLGGNFKEAWGIWTIPDSPCSNKKDAAMVWKLDNSNKLASADAQCALAKCLAATAILIAEKAMRDDVEYNPLGGPNCNSFMNELLVKCGAAIEMTTGFEIGKALGWARFFSEPDSKHSAAPILWYPSTEPPKDLKDRALRPK